MRNRESKQASVGDLRKFIAYYQKKHNIRIIVNGDTLPENQEVTARIALLRDAKHQYVAYLLKWLNGMVGAKGMGDLEITPCEESGVESNKLFAIIKDSAVIPEKFFDTYGDFRDDLDDSEIEELNQAIANHAELKRHLDARITLEIQRLELRKPKKEAAIEEIKSICANLPPGDQVGYVYTGQVYTDEDHFQALILERGSVICPTFMPLVETIQGASFFGSPIIFYTSPAFGVENKYRSAQMDFVSCGTLGVLYLKKLLKNAGDEFKNDTLKFAYYSGAQLKGLFIPSADTLQFSQSKIFNEALVLMVNSDDDTFELPVPNRGVIKHATVSGILRKSIESAKALGDAKTQMENERTLEQLTGFRIKWNAAAKISLAKHGAADLDGRNYRLAHKNSKLLEKSGALFSRSERSRSGSEFPDSDPPISPRVK